MKKDILAFTVSTLAITAAEGTVTQKITSESKEGGRYIKMMSKKLKSNVAKCLKEDSIKFSTPNPKDEL